ncbi:hypothetical protein QTP88_023863 [Uroleucon formosanum]
MIRFIFKGTNITVHIYKEQNFSETEKQQIIYEYHNSPLGGHSGVTRTVKRLKANYQWKNLKKSVKQYIARCEICQKTKSNLKTKQPMLITTTVTKSFERICLDIVGPLPQTSLGNQFILTMQDELTRYALAVALSATGAQTVAQAFVECFVCVYGIPKSILTDCGTNFLSDVFKQMCKLLDIEKSQTTPFHPQTNGFLERSHKTLKTYLRSFVDKDNEWDQLLCYAMYCYNSTIHTSTNYTPYELVFGHKPTIPAILSRKVEPQYNYDHYVFDLKRNMQQAHEIARNNLINKKESNKRNYDKTMNPVDVHVGVIRFHDEKLPQQSGLYYENRGTVNIATSKWDLTAFVDLKKYDDQWDFIDNLVTKTEQSYRNISHSVEANCNNLLFLVNGIARQIKEKKGALYHSIGHHDHVAKRSINIGTITKFAQTLYGLCDLNCIKSFDLGIGKLLGNDIKLEKEQLKVIKVKQEYEGREYYHLQLQISELKNITVEQQINNFVFRHFGYMNLLLTKYMAETDILLSIIEAAKLGQIHPYLLGPTDLLAQFQDIRLSLPIGTDFPYPLSLETVNDIVKLSDVKIYYSNNNIVFMLTIPLIYQNNFILYHLIPKPYFHTNIDCIYIAPSHKFLAISKNKEHYVAYDEFHYNQCKHARSFLLCPEIQSLHPRNLRPICEVQLLQDPKEVPTTCDIRHVRLQATIFHKLSYRKKWLYATDSEVIIINCENDQEASTHLLEGVGIISINETCKEYATRDLLLPSTNSENNYSDFIPTSTITQQEFQHVSLDLYTMKDENVINNHMSDLNLISKTHMQLQEHNNNIYKVTQLQNNQIIHNYILYLTIFLTFVIAIAFLQIKSNEQRSLIVEQNEMVQIRQSTGTIHCEEPATSEATAPPITEEAQAAHAYTIYPTLKTWY